MTDREWFVSYDVTHRAIELQHRGDDPALISRDEALVLRGELLAAVTAANEHRFLDGVDS